MDYCIIGHGNCPTIIWSISDQFEWKETKKSSGKHGHGDLDYFKNDRIIASGRIDLCEKIGSIFFGYTLEKYNLKVLNCCVDKYPGIKWKVWYGINLNGSSISKAYKEFEGKI